MHPLHLPLGIMISCYLHIYGFFYSISARSLEFASDMAIGSPPITSWDGTHLAKSGCPGCTSAYPFREEIRVCFVFNLHIKYNTETLLVGQRFSKCFYCKLEMYLFKAVCNNGLISSRL